MLIHNDAELRRAWLMKIMPGLMEYLSGKVEDILKQNLSVADISTSTLQDYVTHTIERKGDTITSDIYIDDRLAQSAEEGTKEWGPLRKFISIDGSTSYNGQTIVWNMINWLEKTGAYGTIGNNPIMPIGMFANTGNEVNKNLDKWIKEYLSKRGF